MLGAVQDRSSDLPWCANVLVLRFAPLMTDLSYKSYITDLRRGRLGGIYVSSTRILDWEVNLRYDGLGLAGPGVYLGAVPA